jgi:hypothetical protein
MGIWQIPGGIDMRKRDQDVENRLKCLKSNELAELLDFIIPNRMAEGFDDLDALGLPPKPANHPH